MAETDLDDLFRSAGQQEEAESDGEGRRAPRKLATVSNIIAAEKWACREMLSQRIRGDQALAMVRTLSLLRLEIEAVSPEETDLPTQRRLQAAQVDREENHRLKKRLARFEDVDTKQEGEPPTGLFLRGAEPVRVVDHRSANLPNEEEPEAPHSLSAVLVQDASRERKTEEARTW